METGLRAGIGRCCGDTRARTFPLLRPTWERSGRGGHREAGRSAAANSPGGTRCEPARLLGPQLLPRLRRRALFPRVRRAGSQGSLPGAWAGGCCWLLGGGSLAARRGLRAGSSHGRAGARGTAARMGSGGGLNGEGEGLGTVGGEPGRRGRGRGPNGVRGSGSGTKWGGAGEGVGSGLGTEWGGAGDRRGRGRSPNGWRGSGSGLGTAWGAGLRRGAGLGRGLGTAWGGQRGGGGRSLAEGRGFWAKGG